MTAVICFSIGLHRKKAAEMFATSKGLIKFMKTHTLIERK